MTEQLTNTPLPKDAALMLSIAQQVVRLNPTAKVSGIKLIRSIFSTSLRDTKLLWEIGASLQGYDTRPNKGTSPRETQELS